MKSLSILFTLSVLMLIGCTDSKLEKRVSELERRLALMENGGSTSSPISLANQPANATLNNAVNANEPEVKPEGPLPEFKFGSETFDFGEISEGETIEHTFTFVNTGEAPLIIQNASASCGCTVPSYSKEPVPPGGSGEVFVRFDSKNKKGAQSPTVTVTANTFPKVTKLRLKGSVNTL